MIKECKEEAGIPEKLASSAQPAGTLWYLVFIFNFSYLFVVVLGGKYSWCFLWFIVFDFHSYYHENELGLHPEIQFVFDLELPRSFEPTNTDDEVSDFYLLPIKEVCRVSHQNLLY